MAALAARRPPAGCAWLRDSLDVTETVSGQAPEAGDSPETQQRNAVLASARARAELGAVMAMYWPWGDDKTVGGVVLHPTDATKPPVFVPAASDCLVLVHTAAYTVQVLPVVGASGSTAPLVTMWMHPSLLFTKPAPEK